MTTEKPAAAPKAAPQQLPLEQAAKTTAVAVAAQPSSAPALSKQSPVLALALQLQFADAQSFARTLKATVMPGSSNDEQVAMLCSVALAHGLNPLKREIYAFPDKGGIRPIIGVDGWYTIANSHPMFDGIDFEFAGLVPDKTLSCTCRIYRKDRSHPVLVTEFLDECYRGTEPWKNNTRRMLRHRAAIQAIRIAFGLAGVMDEDEFERMVEFESVRARPLPAPGDPLRHGGVRTATEAQRVLETRRDPKAEVGLPERERPMYEDVADVPFTEKDEQGHQQDAPLDPNELPDYSGSEIGEQRD